MKRTVLLAVLSIMTVAAVIYRPDEAFQASLQGLTIWWNIVFPGLLPFLALLEMMMAFGAVHALGVLLDPLTRRLFRLPGEAGLAVAVGWMAGFPSGAAATAALRKRGAVSRPEGQRLLALSHMPSPLLMLIVVGSGFMGRPEQGALIAALVWTTALIAGFVHARLGRGSDTGKGPGTAYSGNESLSSLASAMPSVDASDTRAAGLPAMGSAHARSSGSNKRPSLVRRAANAMADARARDGRSFGKAIGDAVTEAVYKLLVVGGFMMICSVLVRLLLPLVPQMLPGYVMPVLVEVHIGTYGAASANVPGGSAWTAAVLAAALGWGGFCALLQAGSAVGGTDLSLRRLAVARLVHAALAFGLTLAAWRPLTGAIAAMRKLAAPTAALPGTGDGIARPVAGIYRAADLHSLWPYMPLLLLLFAGAIVLVALLSAGTGAVARKPQ